MSMTLLEPTANSLTPLACHLYRLSVAAAKAMSPVVLIGRHPNLVRAQDDLIRFAAARAPVLVEGETGTGKDLFARAIHLLSGRRSRPFVALNCAQYQDPTLSASELFGHRRGSFTGAHAEHVGLFQMADSGTLFLDEVADASQALQGLVLRATGEGEIVPLGCNHSRAVDVRLVAASAQNLRTLARSGEFRLDLYYRLQTLKIRVPPLRERLDDVKAIAHYFVQYFNARESEDKQVTAEADAVLVSHDWPGNIRELRSVVEAAFYRAASGRIDGEEVSAEIAGGMTHRSPGDSRETPRAQMSPQTQRPGQGRP